MLHSCIHQTDTIIEPDDDEIRDTFAARRLVETALIREFTLLATPAQIRMLRDHLRRQHEAIDGNDIALRTHLLTDFHVRIAEILDNAVVTRMVLDHTLRTNLISMLYQTTQVVPAPCTICCGNEFMIHGNARQRPLELEEVFA